MLKKFAALRRSRDAARLDDARATYDAACGHHADAVVAACRARDAYNAAIYIGAYYCPRDASYDVVHAALVAYDVARVDYYVTSDAAYFANVARVAASGKFVVAQQRYNKWCYH